MNILPKKRWHVRTKENIARVRKDEAQAAEEERIRQERVKLAEREARTELLRKRAQENLKLKTFISLKSASEDTDVITSNQPRNDDHVNFFQDVEDGTAELKKSNKEHDKEKKEEQEKYEKQIGYLTYLGQDTNEALGKQSWYNVPPDRSSGTVEVDMKHKLREDPLEVIKKFSSSLSSSKGNKQDSHNITSGTSSSTIGKSNIYASIGGKRKQSDSPVHSKHKKKKKKHKKHKKSKKSSRHVSDDSSDNNVSSEDEDERERRKQRLEILRLERLHREREERRKSELLLAKLRGENVEENKPKEPEVVRKYNSQFNPELAKQNYSQSRYTNSR